MSNPATSNGIWERRMQGVVDDAYDDGFNRGYAHCKRKVLEILNRPLQNADLSWDECEQRYIEKIEEL